MDGSMRVSAVRTGVIEHLDKDVLGIRISQQRPAMCIQLELASNVDHPGFRFLGFRSFSSAAFSSSVFSSAAFFSPV